jgi:hypothetical protein
MSNQPQYCIEIKNRLNANIPEISGGEEKIYFDSKLRRNQIFIFAEAPTFLGLLKKSAFEIRPTVPPPSKRSEAWRWNYQISRKKHQ